MKFFELLKYRKINTSKLPENCVIVVVCKSLKHNPINKKIYSLMAHIVNNNY